MRRSINGLAAIVNNAFRDPFHQVFCVCNKKRTMINIALITTDFGYTFADLKKEL